MARLPSGWHWVSGRDKKLGAIDPMGVVHTRHMAETLGAAEVGFKNPYEQRKARSHFRDLQRDTGARGRNYQRDLEMAEAAAARRGEKFDRAKFEANVSALGVEDSERARHAKALYLQMTGRVDTFEQGLESA